MLRLMKYEMRKNILGVAILFSIIMGLECYFLVSAFASSGEHTIISAAILMLVTFVAYFCVFIFGINTYSKELKSKSGYMTFMTPISSFTVIGSKLLVTLLEGIFFAVLLIVLACIDMAVMEAQFPETKIFTDFVDMFVTAMDINAGEILLGILGSILELLITFVAIVSMAYLAITLSSTAFQNRKFKGIISTIIFIVIMVIVSEVAELILNDASASNTFDLFIAMIPAFLYYIAVAVISIFVSGTLLEKKVSL